MNTKSAWIYCRIDAPEDVHGALKGQYEKLNTYATQMGFTVADSSQDLASGLQFDRPGLISVLEVAKAGAFQVLLVDSVSRIGHDAANTIDFIHELNSYDVSVFSPLEGEIEVEHQNKMLSSGGERYVKIARSK